MDSASENEELGSSFMSSTATTTTGDNTQYLLAGDDTEEEDRDDDDVDRTGVLREQDRFLPIANVARLMKKSIPKTGKIAKDARECVQECVSEFVSFITSEASDRCHQEKRKTINGEDILFAMSSLGFDNYVEPLKIYLQKYREAMKGDKTLVEGDCYMTTIPLEGVEISEELLTDTGGSQETVVIGSSQSQSHGSSQGTTISIVSSDNSQTTVDGNNVIFTYTQAGNTDPLATPTKQEYTLE